MSTTTNNLLDGKALAERIQSQLKAQIEALSPQIGRSPGLAVVMVGDNPASAAYVRNKERACANVGIASFGQHFPADTSQLELEQVIHALNQDERVGGLSGCGSLAQATNGINFGLGNSVTNISDAKSSQQQGVVNLQGQVTDIVPLMEPWQAYQLQDASGTVWVITSQPGLSKADRVLIKGNLRYQSIPLDRQELGDFYIEEQERTKQTPAS